MTSTTPTQKALVFTKVGQPLALVHDRAVPEPGPNQVQIRVTVAGLNPHDRLARDLGFFVNKPGAAGLPMVLGNDVVGVVTRLGPGVTAYAVGDRVVSQASLAAPAWNESGLQEYAIATLGASARIPDSLSDDAAATLPTNVIAGVVALFHVLGIPAPWASAEAKREFGDLATTTLLIVGGGANCGRIGVQLAALAGIGRIVVVGGDAAELTALGATHVLDRHGGLGAVLARVRAVVGDDLALAYDVASAPEDQALAVSALSNHRRGAMARLRPMGRAVDATQVVGEKRAGYDVRDVLGMSALQPQVAGPFWERLPGYLESGQIKPTEYVAVKGLDTVRANEVLDAYRDGKKVVQTHFHP